jgi:hypothetical protein
VNVIGIGARLRVLRPYCVRPRPLLNSGIDVNLEEEKGAIRGYTEILDKVAMVTRGAVGIGIGCTYGRQSQGRLFLYEARGSPHESPRWRKINSRRCYIRYFALLTLLLTAPTVSLLSCGPPEKFPAGFRLPDGDIEGGRQTFLELKCNACHEVKGVDFPPPVADPPVPVALGGIVDYQPTDGRFVTSIVNPSHKLAPGYEKELIKRGGESRMADYGDVMTVRQLLDLVAFLHSQYEYRPPGLAVTRSLRPRRGPSRRPLLPITHSSEAATAWSGRSAGATLVSTRN